MSEDLHNNIDDLFKKAIDDLDESPSSNVWEAIDKNLDKHKVVSILKKYNKLKWAAASLLIFSFGLAMYTWHTSVKNKELVKKNDSTKKSGNSKIINDSIEKTSITAEEAKNNKPEKNSFDEDSIYNLSKLNKDSQNTLTDSQKKDRETNQDDPYKNQAATENKKNNLKKQHGEITLTQTDKNLSFKEKNSETNKPEQRNMEDERVSNNSQTKNVTGNINPSSEKIKTAIPFVNNGEPYFKNNLSWQPSLSLKSKESLSQDNADATKNNLTGNQKTSAKKANAGKRSLLSITAFYSAEIVSANVKDDHPRFREDDKNEIKNNETPRNTYRFGAIVSLNVGKKWSLESGVSMFTKVTDIKAKTLYARPDEHGNVNYHLSCTAGSAYFSVKSSMNPANPSPPPPPAQGDSAKSLSAKNTLQYIAVPLAVKYTIGKGKFTISPAAGIALNILSKGKIETNIAAQGGPENTGTNNIEGLKSSYINSLLILNAEYSISKKISVNFIPSARLALSSINKDAPVKTKFNSLGFGAGVTVKL